MSPIERAFAEARTGRHRNLSELFRSLRSHGISEASLCGPALRRQLSAAIRGRETAALPVRQPELSRRRWSRNAERARMLAAMCET